MKRLLIMAGMVGLAAGCGPSEHKPTEMQRRVCDMIAEAEAYTVAYWDDPANVGVLTPQEKAAGVAAHRPRAKAEVSIRLALSLREVDEALKKCGPDSTLTQKR